MTFKELLDDPRNWTKTEDEIYYMTNSRGFPSSEYKIGRKYFNVPTQKTLAEYVYNYFQAKNITFDDLMIDLCFRKMTQDEIRTLLYSDLVSLKTVTEINKKLQPGTDTPTYDRLYEYYNKQVFTQGQDVSVSNNETHWVSAKYIAEYEGKHVVHTNYQSGLNEILAFEYCEPIATGMGSTKSITTNPCSETEMDEPGEPIDTIGKSVLMVDEPTVNNNLSISTDEYGTINVYYRPIVGVGRVNLPLTITGGE